MKANWMDKYRVLQWSAYGPCRLWVSTLSVLWPPVCGASSLAVAAITKLLWWWWFYFIYQLWIWHRRFSCYRLFSNRVRNLADVLTGCSGLLQGEVSNLRATLQTRLQTDDFRKVSLLSAAAAEKTHAKSFGSSYFCMYALQPYVRD